MIEIDLSFIRQIGQMSVFETLWYFFIHGGWIFMAAITLWGLGQAYMLWRQNVFSSKQTYVLLALDVPKMNIQSPKAVENIFAALAGAHSDPNLKEKYIDGYYQIGYSFEIVSVDGYIQFLIRTPVKFRDLVEAAIYAQYPDAEITEVNDYAAASKVKMPDEEYDLWGSDITLVKPYVYPIRTYPEFEHSLTQELKDPMAAMLEIMGSVGPGEQMWFQILTTPVLGKDWQEKCEKEINKILGISGPAKRSKLQKVFEAPLDFVTLAKEQMLGGGKAEGEEKKKEPNMIAYLPPHQKAKVEGIGRKMSKIGYKTKIRFIYMARKEVMRKGLGVSGLFGIMKQYNTEDLNAMKPHKKTKTVPPYLFSKRRKAAKQNRILELYIKRSMDSYGDHFYMNIEELASLYHFPATEVKAPLVQKIESKKGSAPMSLPTELTEEKPILGEPPKKEKPEPERQPVIDFDTDDFEKRFAVDKSGESTKARKEFIKEKYDIEKEKPKSESEELTYPASADFKSEKTVKEKPKDKKESAPGNLPFAD